MEKFKEIEKELLNCERLYYVGFCILKEPRVLKKVLFELSRICLKIVNLLTSEKIFSDEKERIRFFVKKFVLKKLEKENIDNLIEIMKFYDMHKESSLEFVRKEKIIIYYRGRYETITKEKIVNGLTSIKLLIKKLSEE